MLRLNHVTFACEDQRRLAEFWGELLGYDAHAKGESWEATDPRGENVSLFFIRMPKSPTLELPIHLDVNAPDREGEVNRALDLGAKLVEAKNVKVGPLDENWTVLRDPEGNGFCLQGPDSRKPHPYIRNVTFACAEPRRVVGPFWLEALGWQEEQIPDDFLDSLRAARVDVDREFFAYYGAVNPDGSQPRFFFQRREKSRPQSHPIHVDFLADDREAEIERLTAAGATVVETKAGGGHTWTVMRDPEGNPFCVE